MFFPRPFPPVPESVDRVVSLSFSEEDLREMVSQEMKKEEKTYLWKNYEFELVEEMVQELEDSLLNHLVKDLTYEFSTDSEPEENRSTTADDTEYVRLPEQGQHSTCQPP